MKEDVKKVTIGTYWMISERNECFNDEIATYVVELLVHQHKKPEVQEAKKVKLKNFKDYDTFEEVFNRSAMVYLNNLCSTCLLDAMLSNKGLKLV